MERVKCINTDKAASERPIRLRHIVHIPKKMIPKPVQKAYAERQKADAEWQKAYAEWEKADAKWQKAYAERRKAYAERQKAYAEKLLAYLHKHVKDCRWNGKEIQFS
jgi:Skp family chaperone for outer membrane proteins